MTSAPLTYQALEENIDDRSLARGEAYREEGRVIEHHALHDGPTSLMVTGEVRGSGTRRYQVYIQIARDPGGDLEIDGDCSCPVAYNCKHVAAVLLQQLHTAANTAPAAGLDLTVASWLEQLADAARAQPETLAGYPPELRERLLYLLDWPPHPPQPRRLEVTPVICRALRRGGYGKAQRFSTRRVWEPYPPAYLLPADLRLLRELAPNPYAVQHAPQLRGAMGATRLAALLATGRCHWRDKDTAPLRQGDPRAATAHWRLDSDGLQRLEFRTAEPVTAILPLAPPWYLDEAQRCCGPLETSLPPAVAEALALAPELDPKSAAALSQRLRRTLPQLPLPQPRTISVNERRVPAPSPMLTLTQTVLGQRWIGDHARMRLACARLAFDYDGHAIAWDEPAAEHLVRDGAAGVTRLHRATDAEQTAMERLRETGLEPLGEWLPGGAADQAALWTYADLDHALDGWLALQLDHLPGLRAAGWRVTVAADFPWPVVTPNGWWGELHATENADWFNLALGVEVAGERVPLLPLLAEWLEGLPDGKAAAALLAKLSDTDPVIAPLGDGRLLPIPAGRVRNVLQTLVELYDASALAGDTLRVSRWQAPQVEELGRDGWHWSGGEPLRELGARLRDFQGIAAAPLPAGFGATLRPYQQHGLEWLQFLREYRLGGILADDMGLGKTIQTLAHLLIEKQSGRADRPSLVVAPTSLLFNWRREAAQFAPALTVLVLHGPRRGEHFAHLGGYDLVLTSYPLLPRDAAVLQAQPFHLVILDEAQTIKNPRAKAAAVARDLRARHRLCLTGTPLENHLGELWSLFHFLAPGLLGEAPSFRQLFRIPIEKQGDEARRAALARRVRPFLLRRTKTEVAAELPAKTEILRTVELEGAQRDLYETVRLAMHQKVRATIERKGLNASHIEILDALLKLRQICCDPRLVKLEQARRVTESAKLRLLLDLLPEMIEEGRRILLFSQFTSMLGLIETELVRLGQDYVKLTGRTRDRATVVDRFQNGEVGLFLISLKAGGTGLNLTAADTVIHYDPWWNPAVEDQATDRAHRIGQDKKVFVYKLITAGSVEEKIVALQQRKRGLADGLFAAAGGAGQRLEREDLEHLFEPLEP